MYKNFTFYVPRCSFGVGESRKLGTYVKKLNGSKALLIYDLGVKKAGVVDPILSALHVDGIATVEFDQVMADPSMDCVDEAAALGRSEKVDVAIAIGGGSSIDTGKTARMLITNPGKAKDYTVDQGTDLFKEKGLPYIVVPTTSGTGSEVTFSSVLTNTENDRKVAVRDFTKMPADFAVLDPEVTLGLPPHITASTGMDVLTHAAEAYLKPLATPFSDALNLYAAELCMENLEAAVKDGKNIEVRANMMLASTMAGAGIASCGLHIGHGMAQAMGAAWHMAHGVACALCLPYVFEHNCEAMPEKTKMLACALGVEFDPAAQVAEIKDLIVGKILRLSDAIGIPTLRALGKTKEKDLETILEFTKRERKLCQQAARPFTDEDSLRYYTHMFSR